jgi:hypothetical protein
MSRAGFGGGREQRVGAAGPAQVTVLPGLARAGGRPVHRPILASVDPDVASCSLLGA